MIKTGIAGRDGQIADVVDGDEMHGIVVATRPLKEYTNKLTFFTNDTFGRDMNQDASFGGNPDEIHDGIDAVYWTASAISGAWTFNSAAQNHTPAGAQSIDATGTLNGNEALFTRGAPIALSGYVALTGWIYITSWGAVGTRHVELRARLATADIGNTVNADDYVDTATIGSWQKFSIPKSDLGLGGENIDELVVQTINSGGAAPNYYLDDLQWEETGVDLFYTVVPEIGTWLHIDKLMVVYADAYTGIVTVAGNTENATMPSIPYDGFFGVSALDSGIIYHRHGEGVIQVTSPIKQHSDLMNFSNAQVTGYGSDGTSSWVSVVVNFSAGVILKSEDDDFLELHITEDLSGLDMLRFSAGGFEEQRT